MLFLPQVQRTRVVATRSCYSLGAFRVSPA